MHDHLVGVPPQRVRPRGPHRGAPVLVARAVRPCGLLRTHVVLHATVVVALLAVQTAVHKAPHADPITHLRNATRDVHMRGQKEEGRGRTGRGRTGTRKDGRTEETRDHTALFSCSIVLSCSLLFSLFSLFSFFSLFLSPHLELAHARPHVGHCAAQLMAGDARVFLNGREGEEDRLWRKNE